MEFGLASTVVIGAVTVLNVTEFDAPFMKFDKQEITSLSTTLSRAYVVEPLGDPQEFSFTSIYDPATYTSLTGLVGTAGETCVATIHGATTTKTLTFTGFITECKVKVAGFNEKDMMTTTVQPQGAIVLS